MVLKEIIVLLVGFFAGAFFVYTESKFPFKKEYVFYKKV